mmetsp:Transcript_114664/g.357125  ORF Transcript_114664/g.357125 Transcript_114664/m.357125 type:complete len:437 (+) Transcript_114664:80-1390(+)
MKPPAHSPALLLCLAVLPAVQPSLLHVQQEGPAAPVVWPSVLQLQQDASSEGAEEESAAFAWAIVGVDGYYIAGHQGDRWSKHDVYVRLVARPCGWTFKSAVEWNADTSVRQFYAYVPSDSKVDVELWERNQGFNDDLIGRTTVDVGASVPGRLTRKRKVSLSTATVTVVRGREAVQEAAAVLGRTGVFVEYREDGGSSKYALVRVPVLGVEEHLAYATAESVLPTELQGIWWMDQRGVHLRDFPSGPPGDEGYRQECAQAVDQVLLAFGEAGWDPVGHGCVVSQHIYAGGPLRGHWTWLDQTGAGDSSGWDGSAFNVPNAHFCFQDAERTRINIPRYWEAFWGFRFPDWVMELGMVRKPWGWDRVTHLGPGGLLGTCHYPVWQVVDGFGLRTEHYEAYVRFAGAQSPASQEKSTWESPLNRGNGTMLVARLQPPR